MPQEMKNENANKPLTRLQWQNFHFSGKVIICSVLFGFGLLLIGGLLMVIDSGDHEKMEDNANKENENEQVKAPMSFVGPVIMGVGGFTIIIGIIMCLIETKVLRRRNGDSRPLITTPQSEPETTLSQPREIQQTAVRKKHNHRKKSPSPGRSKMNPKRVSPDKSKHSPQMGQARNVTSDKNSLTVSKEFLTPINSLTNNSVIFRQDSKESDKEASQSLITSYASSSETSYNTSVEFQTPTASFESGYSTKESNIRTKRLEIHTSATNINECSTETILSSSEFLTPVTSLDPYNENIFFQTTVSEMEGTTKPTDASHLMQVPEQLETVSTHLQRNNADIKTDEMKNNELTTENLTFNQASRSKDVTFANEENIDVYHKQSDSDFKSFNLSIVKQVLEDQDNRANTDSDERTIDSLPVEHKIAEVTECSTNDNIKDQKISDKSPSVTNRAESISEKSKAEERSINSSIKESFEVKNIAEHLFPSPEHQTEVENFVDNLNFEHVSAESVKPEGILGTELKETNTEL